MQRLRELVSRVIIAFIDKSNPNIEVADSLDLYYCYKFLLGRRPDPEGWATHLKAIRRGMPVKNLVGNFIASTAFRQMYEKQSILVRVNDSFAMYVDPDDLDIGRGIVTDRAYEPHVTALLQRELHENQVFLDVGANMGWFTLLAAPILHAGKVIAIEPNHDNVQLIYRSLIENEFTNISVFPFAATDVDGLLQLNYVRSNGYVTAVGDFRNTASYVHGVRLDDLLRDEPRIDIVKIDIEGHEPRALSGMAGIIRRDHPVIVSEFHPKAMREASGIEGSDYLHTMMNWGYRLSIIETNGDEIECANGDAIMEYWRAYNHKSGTEDELHLDLVARSL